MGTKHKIDIAIIDSSSSSCPTAEPRQLLNIHILSVTMGAKKRTGPVAATAIPNSKTGISKQADTREIRQESELAVPSTTTQSWPAPQVNRVAWHVISTWHKLLSLWHGSPGLWQERSAVCSFSGFPSSAGLKGSSEMVADFSCQKS